MGQSDDDIRAQKRLGKAYVRSDESPPPTGTIEDKTVLSANTLDETAVKIESESESEGVALRYIGMVLLDRYELIEFLGKGGMSTVFKARHVLTQRIIACKIMHQILVSNAESIIRFQQEATSASRIHHPNVIGVHDLGETPDGLPFLIMDFLRGESLATVLHQSGTFCVERFLNIFIQATSALSAAHEKGVVHRDLKPANIMLSRQSDGSDFVTIVDFGIAKVLKDDEESFKLTRPGAIFGSPLYMSPEQCSGSIPDNRADIYSLGCMMYECLSGRPPFQSDSMLETMQKHMFAAPPEMPRINAAPHIAKKISHAVLKCLRKEPENRYQKVDDLLAELKSIQAQQNQLGTYGRLVAPLATLLAIVIVASGIFLWPAYGPMPDPAQWERNLQYEWPGGSVFSTLINSDSNTPMNYDAYDWYCRKDNVTSDDPRGQLKKTQRLANFYQQVGKFEAALANYNGALMIMADDRLQLQGSIEESDTLLATAECLMELGNYKLAEEQTQKSLRIRADLGYGGGDYQSIRAAYILGHACKEQGPSRYEEAKRTFQPLVDLVKRSSSRGELDRGHPERVALEICDVAELYSLMHDYPGACDLYSRALTVLDLPALKGNHYNVGAIRNQLGLVKMDQGEYAVAQYDFEKSIEELQQVRDLNSVSIAKVRFNLSDAMWKQGKWWDALETRARARQVWRKADKDADEANKKPPAKTTTPAAETPTSAPPSTTVTPATNANPSNSK